MHEASVKSVNICESVKYYQNTYVCCKNIHLMEIHECVVRDRM